jgi:two-component system, cell cycle sensor histidine kinase and response regulator CckA
MNAVTQFQGTHDSLRHLRFQASFEEAAIGIAICQLDGRIMEANTALATVLGCTQPELVGRAIYPETFSPAESLLDELRRGERDRFEIENSYVRKEGSEFWGHLTVSLSRDAGREPAFLIAMLTDATRRKLVEEHLREAEKLEVIGRMAAAIAHDFNNLLTGILLYCDLLTAGLESSDLRHHVEEVRMAGEQGAALTHQLLAIVRKQALPPRPVSINEVVSSTQNLLQRIIGEQVKLVVILDSVLDSSAGLVLADPAQLRQILLNLVLNARDSMPHGGTITLSTRVVESPGTVGPGSSQRALALMVKDNGCGMDAETRRRLFEPFFTTKGPDKGTGLGLSTVQRIVSESGGSIAVESELERGTCIEVHLPAIESS